MIKTTQKKLASFMRKLRRLRALPQANSGVAMIEFAFTAPIVLALGMLGTETAYYATTHMRVSQIAMQVADNASRVGEQNVLVARRVFEDDINETFVGAEKLGEGIEIFEHGRVILSSLQQNEDGGQWIQWQRCRGAKNHTSSFGNEGSGEFGTSFPGMGESGKEITAATGTAVMFVEIVYDYQALTPFDYLDGDTLTYTAAFNIRDNRDLTQLYPSQSGANTASCATFSADRP
ncbi:MAG: TadE family protein [Pseudomonadota bacterium]